MFKSQEVNNKDLTHLLLSIAAISTLSALDVHGFKIAWLAFFVALVISGALAFFIVYKLICIPMQEGKIFQSIPNGVVLFIFSVVLIRLSTSGFDEDDEIYSWNMWAIQHFMGKPADFKFTGSPYPQLFSYWIAGMYQAMNGYVNQAIPRAFLSLSTLLMATCLVAVLPARSWKSSFFSATVIFLVLAPVIAWMARGLADPLMAAAMLISAFSLYRYYQEPTCLTHLVYGLISAVIASLTKQAGIFWICISVPVIMIWGVYKWNLPRVGLLYCIVAVVISLIWPLFISPTFINNQGVISASIEGRSVIQQLWFSVDEYIFKRPYFVALYIFLLYSIFINRFIRLIFFVAILPMLILWFQFGAYSLRLGIHVIGLTGLLVIIGFSDAFDDKINKSSLSIARARLHFFAMILSLFLIITLYASVLKISDVTKIDLRDGAKNTIRTQWGAEALPIFEVIMQKNYPIWVVSNYAYGALYGRVDLREPSRLYENLEMNALREDLLSSGARYVIYSELIPNPPITDMLKSLVIHCPDGFNLLLGPGNQKNFMLYEINRNQLAMELCN